MKNAYFILLFLSISLNNSVLGQNFPYEKLVGKWTMTQAQHTSILFTKKKTMHHFYYDQELIIPSKFKLRHKNDSLFLYQIYKNIYVNGKDKRSYKKKAVIWKDDEHLTIAWYKIGKDIRSHIDEYETYKKEGSTSSLKNLKRKEIIYVFPENFIGSAWIAFNQKDGTEPDIDSLGNFVLKIPSDGILKTTLHEDVYATANHLYTIKSEIKGVPFNYKSCDKFDNIDSTFCKRDELIAVMCGFNQTSRESINSFFKEKIRGNVMTLYICTYSELKRNSIAPWKKNN